MENSLLSELLKNYTDMCLTIEKLKKKGVKTRKPNFPEVISEYMVQKIIDGQKPKTGDLICKGKRFEVKCIASKGPVSFGPKEKWDWIVFVLATRYPEIEFYFYNIKNDCDIWLDIKINKNQTFRAQIGEKRRPRIEFDKLKKQLPKANKIIKYDIIDILENNFQKIQLNL